ncbi:unnamed protein product, partial [Effrenium voratum]
MMPTLLHQQLPGLGWTLLHCCACRGQASQARLLVRLSASPFQRDAKGRNVLDVALQHNEFGVVEDLLAVLMEQRSAECGSHLWDRHGEDVEVLGRALLARSLPAEHLSLTRTVVRLLKMRTATLPEFLDRVCCGVPGHFEVTRAGERLKALPARAALQEKEMKIRSYSAPVYRPDAPEFRGLVPSFEDASTPERPVEINVWYLRGALDDEVGLIPALQESDQEEMMRTNFVHVLLEEQWTTVGRRQFRVELALYLVYMACFAGFCMAGRGSCPPPETLAEDFQSFSGSALQLIRVLLALYQLFFLYVEMTQLFFEVRRAETHGLTHGWWERLRALLSYFTTWNNLDMMRIALVTTAIVWSIVDREGVFIGEGKNLLAITTVFVCSRLISFLRAFPTTGHLVRTLVTIFWDMAVFFRLMILMMLTFVFAFLLLYGQPFTLDGFGTMMWYVYVHGVFGDTDDAPEGGDDTSLTAKFLLVSMVIVMLVVMMNFLIAIMSDSYDKVQESAEVARNFMRLELVYEAAVSNIIPKRRRLPKAYVFTCEGVRYAGGQPVQEASRWEGRVRQVE